MPSSRGPSSSVSLSPAASHRRGSRSPLPTAGLPTPLPGNWYLFLACVGSLLSTAADGLYLADFNELRVADIRLGSTFLACVRMSMLGMVCSSACVPVHLCVCIRCRSMRWCIHGHEDKCVSVGVYLCSACALLGTCTASDIS